MIIETRVFNRATGKMFYLSPFRPERDRIVAVAREAVDFAVNDPVMIKSPHSDDQGQSVWEGDILECGIETPVGLVAEKGVMLLHQGGFTISIDRKYGEETNYQIVGLRRIGNIFENPELISKKQLNDTHSTQQN